MKLQVSSQLAIFALLELAAAPDRQLTVGEIGEKYDVSSHHLAKVMHVLGRAGLVRAARGAGGGYQFSGNARRVTLLDVIQLFEQLTSTDDNFNANHDGTDEGQALRQVLGEVDAIARATLGSVTLATMRKIVERQREGTKPSRARARS